MQYTVSFSASFTIGMLFFIMYPVASAYYRALSFSDLPNNQIAILTLFAIIAGLSGICFGCVLISQTKEAYILDLLTIIMTFFAQKRILNKGPMFFKKHFFKRKEEQEEAVN